MGRSIRSKKLRSNRAVLRARYAPKEMEKLKKTVAKLPIAPKVEAMDTVDEDKSNEKPRTAPTDDATTGDVEMGGEGATITKSQLKKKLAKRHMSKLKKKGINVTKKKNAFRF